MMCHNGITKANLSGLLAESRRLEHVPEKWKPVFRKGHAITKISRTLPDSI
jgi:hypothetical protein